MHSYQLFCGRHKLSQRSLSLELIPAPIARLCYYQYHSAMAQLIGRGPQRRGTARLPGQGRFAIRPTRPPHTSCSRLPDTALLPSSRARKKHPLSSRYSQGQGVSDLVLRESARSLAQDSGISIGFSDLELLRSNSTLGPSPRPSTPRGLASEPLGRSPRASLSQEDMGDSPPPSDPLGARTPTPSPSRALPRPRLRPRLKAVSDAT